MKRLIVKAFQAIARQGELASCGDQSGRACRMAVADWQPYKYR